MGTREDLVANISTILNHASRETKSDTPDWILAEYMVKSLEEFEAGVVSREEWYGRVAKNFMGGN